MLVLRHHERVAWKTQILLSLALLALSCTACAPLARGPSGPAGEASPSASPRDMEPVPAPHPQDVAGLLDPVSEAALDPTAVEEPSALQPGSPLDELAGLAPEISPEQAALDRAIAARHSPEFDIPIVLNDQVMAWVDHYARKNRDSFRPGLVRSGRYIGMFREIFEEAGLPRDLAYMAHVESAYKLHAYSRAHAKGCFQFIASTGRRHGLRIDWWVDERSDPEKSAKAATSYLRALYEEFGDWYLALAAYNGGEGRVRRAIALGGGRRDFWAIQKHLRRETRNYVPAILAVTLISKDPEKYGFRFEPDPPVVYDTVQVRGAADLHVLARCAGSDFETLEALNPALRRLQTPPDGVTPVRVPVGRGTRTLAALESVPSTERVKWVRHPVRRGDTLYELARHYGVSVAAIQRAAEF